MSSAENVPFASPAQVRAGWAPLRVGRRVVTFDEVDSTNAVAFEAAGEPDADGLVILAEAQLQGRGRLGRSWVSPRGASVLCSVVLLEANDLNGEDVSGGASPESATIASTGAWLTQASAVACCEAIRRSTDVTAAIKWPNDIRIDGRKVGGILIETRPVDARTRAWVVGIGLNCLQHAGHFTEELRTTATSLELASSHAVDRVEVARQLLMALDRWLTHERWGRTDALHAAWLSDAEPLGQQVRLRRQGTSYTGRTVEVDPVGGLIVKLDGGGQEWFDPVLTTVE